MLEEAVQERAASSKKSANVPTKIRKENGFGTQVVPSYQ
jgi:hypothetical protein